jgi:hypothetical protein
MENPGEAEGMKYYFGKVNYGVESNGNETAM